MRPAYFRIICCLNKVVISSNLRNNRSFYYFVGPLAKSQEQDDGEYLNAMKKRAAKEYGKKAFYQFNLLSPLPVDAGVMLCAKHSAADTEKKPALKRQNS